MVGTLFRFGGFYDPIGYARRNQPMDAPAVNPLAENKMNLDSGDAGKDGYSVVSRANRVTGERTLQHATPMFEGPELEDY